MRSTPILARALLVLALLGLSGCTDTITVRVDTPVGVQQGDVSITYTLLDSKARVCSIQVEFSSDGGVTFQAATKGSAGEGTANLASSGSGVRHAFAWASKTDMGGARSDRVVVQITPSSGSTRGQAAATDPFTVDNSGGNLPPTAVIVDPKGDSVESPLLSDEFRYGPITFSVDLSDPERDTASLAVEFSTDGGQTYRPITLDVASPPATGLATGNPAPVRHKVVWDTLRDLPQIRRPGIKVKVTPADAKKGLPVLVQFLHVDNANLSVLHPPYLQNASETGISVHWRTETYSNSIVRWGTSPTNLASTLRLDENARWHEARLTGLSAGTTYYYRAYSADREVTGRAGRLRTSKPSSAGGFRFTMFGDCGTGGTAQYAIANVVKNLDPEFHLLLGDIVYSDGALADYPYKYFDPYKSLIDEIVFWPSIGNHDYHINSGEAYKQVFGVPANNPAASELYYSFDHADAHFVALDSNQSMAPGSPQHIWLRSDLAANTKTWTFVFFHHPPYSSSEGGVGNLTIRRNVSPVFEEFGVDLCLTGHEHHYERTQVIRDYYPNNRGVVYVIDGGGGKTLRDVATNPWTAFSRKTYAITEIQVSGRTLNLKAYDDQGRVIDQVTITK